ncbi:hypothetical protein Tco_1530533 [Tanacetum coccineum]
MASLDHRLNPLFSIKECSSCGALYTANFCCSKGGLEDNILVPKPPQNCATCENPVDGLNCRSCAFVRKCLNEGWNDAHHGYDCSPQVPFVYNQDPCFDQNFDTNFPLTSQSFPQQCLCCENCGGSHATFQCQPMNQDFYLSGFDQYQPPQSSNIHPHPQETSKEILQAREDLMGAIQAFLKEYDYIPPNEQCMALLLAEERFGEIKDALMDKQYQQEDIQELMSKLHKDVQNISEEFSEYINCPSWNRPLFYFNNNDDEYTVIWRRPKAITPDAPSEEPEDPLIMGEEELSTIPKKDKSSVENLVPIPSGSKGFSDDICDNDHSDAKSLLSQDILITSPKIDFLSEEFASEIAPIPPEMDKYEFNEEEDDCYDDDTSSDNDSFEKIDYVEASPPESELVSLEEVEDVILRDKLSNVYLLISKIEALNDNPTLSSFSYSDNSFSDHTEETRSGSTTTHANNSLPEYDSFLFEVEPNQGGLTGIVIYDNSNDPLLEPPEFESFHFDLYDDPLFPCPPPEPPDVEISLIVETDAPVINNVDELNEDDDSFTFVIRTFSRFLLTMRFLPYFPPPGVKTPFLTPKSPLRAGGISSGWNFHVI